MIMIHEDILFEEATIIIASFCHNKHEGTQAWVGFLTEWWVGFSKYMFVFLVYARKINYHKSIPPWVPCKLRKTVVEKWCGLCLGRH